VRGCVGAWQRGSVVRGCAHHRKAMRDESARSEARESRPLTPSSPHTAGDEKEDGVARRGDGIHRADSSACRGGHHPRARHPVPPPAVVQGARIHGAVYSPGAAPVQPLLGAHLDRLPCVCGDWCLVWQWGEVVSGRCFGVSTVLAVAARGRQGVELTGTACDMGRATGGAASRPFWQREAGDGKVSEAASVERGSVMLELEHVLGTNYRAPDAKKMQTNFGGGGSMWFRRTSLEYPGGPLAGLPHSCSSRLDCKASLQDVFSARSTWFGLRTEVDPQLLSIRERAGQRVGTDGEWVQWTCAAWQRFKGRAILLVSPRKQGEALQCSARPGMKEPVVRQRAASSLKLREVLALEENDIVVYRLLPGAAACLSENDSAVIFVTEILPRLKPGVLVIIMGISYPHHSNFVSGVKETDAAQFLFQVCAEEGGTPSQLCF